jgi:hypothetical protein
MVAALNVGLIATIIAIGIAILLVLFFIGRV